MVYVKKRGWSRQALKRQGPVPASPGGVENQTRLLEKRVCTAVSPSCAGGAVLAVWKVRARPRCPKPWGPLQQPSQPAEGLDSIWHRILVLWEPGPELGGPDSSSGPTWAKGHFVLLSAPWRLKTPLSTLDPRLLCCVCVGPGLQASSLRS